MFDFLFMNKDLHLKLETNPLSEVNRCRTLPSVYERRIYDSKRATEEQNRR